ncbi:efflux RND transporter permease subunit [Bradyrhizobium sp.]|uniref:efflux RND transporter permease subunit n=1 Tax=Bradyrhizobium sp. TaxID=376 RepID=UPI002C6ECBE0|nr:MMPL family transporter [Bradyrhizobium sp.]HMM87640.1 MMPL family transporter [Bradyrhizobium sp.]
MALGIERVGLASLRFPRAVGLLALVLAVFCGFGITRIKIDDSLSQLFHADTPEFRLYQQETRRFPSSEFDVLVVVQGKTLLQRASIAKLRNLVIDLQLIDGTRGIISLFSARQPPAAGKLSGPLIPNELPQGTDYEQLVQRFRSNEIVRNKLLSSDGTLTLIVLALDPDAVQSTKLSGVVDQIRQTAHNDLTGTNLTASLTGVPVMQLEIRNALERDRIIYNAFGFAAGCLIAMAFFRRVSFMIVAAAPPLLAILLGLGTLGWLGFELNLFLNVMTPLIMVISFSDSMQLTFAARDRLIAGADRRTAFRDAILIVGPACVLTHGTAALSFIALQFSQSDLIRSFGAAGLICTAIALVTVLTLVPLFGLLLVRHEGELAARARKSDRGVEFLRTFCGWVAARMVSRPAIYSLVGLLVVGGLGAVYAQLQPRYRLADQVPDQGQAVAASDRLDAELTGANPINVMIQLPSDASLYAPQSLQLIAEVHHLMESESGVGNVWSLETLRRWLAEKTGKSDVATLKQYVDMLPQYLVRRFISADQHAVIVAGRVPDLDASRIRPIVRSLDKALGPIRAQNPGFTISVTSLSAIAARNSATMIEQLNHGLTVEVVFVAAFVGLAFRSWRVMAASLLPAIFPIVATGALLWMLGDGLQFASVVALTVSFGLGMSATIHFLNRLRLEERFGETIDIAVRRATVLMGPALILTSIVLACGMVVTVFSSLPSLRLFGGLATLAMILALVADLTILRPVITFLRSTRMT